MNWFITGDTHGDNYKRLKNLPKKSAVIILGDASFNYFGDLRDELGKKKVNDLDILVYCVRGNHEIPPCEVPTMKSNYDEYVHGIVYVENEYPNIKYFRDGGNYRIRDKSILVIGGAYSVDKFYRLSHGLNWFENEQLSEREKTTISNSVHGKYFDIVLTHTCPYLWQPTDLFLGSIDQNSVDSSTERWLQEIANKHIIWDNWYFGHFHDDRDITDNIHMLFKKVVPLFEC